MSTGSSQVRHTAAPKRRVLVASKRFSGLILTALCLGLSLAWAEGPDDQYLQIYNLIQRADELNSKGKVAPAKAGYQEAHAALKTFQQGYPDWNVKLVSYRLNYVAQKLAALSEKPPAVPDGGAASSAPAAQPDAKAATPTSARAVKLRESGAEPRKVLRLHPNPGDKQTLSLIMKMAVEMRTGEGESPAIKLPALTMTLNVTVKDVSNSGDITYELVVSDTSLGDEPGALAQAVQGMKAALAGIKGMSATGTLSGCGLSKGTEFKAPPGAGPQTRQLMDQMKDSFAQMAVPLPEEAVGPGAKWEVAMPIKSQGMTVDQTATCELVSIEGERLTIKRTTTQLGSNQKIENPAMPGLKVDLTKMTAKGTGELKLDLGKLLPSAATSDFHSETAMGVNMGGQKQAMTMKTDMKLRLEAK